MTDKNATADAQNTGKEAEGGEKKAADNYLNLKVKSQDGEEVFFKIKKSTQFKKLMDAYCNRQQINPQNVRFLFDGERIAETQTPNELNMEDGDEIDVVIEQTGGCGF
mmetsp:Transcript_28470/g.32930  ORF Transcript_28470/g.32930 Transcript_28470/m.32930 type:complete len:108 (+) Transcript_28470:41-364(+)